MSAVVYYGRVDEVGLLHLNQSGVLGRLPEKVRNKDIVLVIREKDAQRSLPQNAYLHAEPFKKIAEHTGASVTQVKYDLMGECWGWVQSKVSGHVVPVKPSTSKMSKKDCVHFIDWLLPWAETFFNGAVDIMPPQQWWERHPEVTELQEEEEPE